MRKYLYIGVGGALGAILRYLAEGGQIAQYIAAIPLKTLVINVSGSFMLALILTVASGIWKFDTKLRQSVTTGFLGAFTTFSTLCKEVYGLISLGSYYSALFYVFVSIVFGVAAAYSGVVLARQFVSRIAKKEKEGFEEEMAEEIEGGAA